ncbi:putative ankyrin repeat protein RF_1087 isoform X2 [Littorina saxatilis]
MLSLSLFSSPSPSAGSSSKKKKSPFPSPFPSPSLPSKHPHPYRSALDAMKATGDARSEAVTFLGLLRHNEDVLEVRLKHLLKRDRQFVHDVFTSLIDDWTPLHACTLRGARKLVKMALKSGAPPDLEMGAPDGLPGRCSPLHLAAYRGDVSLVQLLVQNGASVDKRDSTRRTPLYYAASKNNVLAARKLIKYGADVNELNGEQRVYYKEDIEGRPSSLLCIPVLSSMR